MSHRKLIFSRWALPVASAPIENAALVIEGERIKTLCRQEDLAEFYSGKDLSLLLQQVTNYGNALIVPGLINLHAHLDYSLLGSIYAKKSSKNPEAEASMFDWLPKLVTESWQWSQEKWQQSALFGIKQALESGTTFIVDNSFTGQSAKLLARAGLRGIVGLELFGQDESLAETAWQKWLGKYKKVIAEADNSLQKAIAGQRIQITVAPHAPYTVAPGLWKKAAIWSKENNLFLLAHIAESSQECAWIRGGNAEIDEYLKFVRELQARSGIIAYNAGAPETAWRGHGLSPCQLLSQHALLNAHLVATHLIHIDEHDAQTLKAAGVRIVHCPRSNFRLNNGVFPLQLIKKHDLCFGLGTDSLASTPNLSLIDEAKAAVSIHNTSDKTMAPPEFSLNYKDALGLITLKAAQVIGMEDKLGSLQEGKLADLAIFKYERQLDEEIGEPLNILFSGKTSKVSVYVGGELI